MRLIAAPILAVLAVLALPATAQETATLVADSVTLEGETLVAEGGVEVLYQGTRLGARGITYDRADGRLAIDGPIRLTDATGDTVILADQAALDDDLMDGILTSARLVIDRELQLAADRIARVGGRYTELSNTVASSCRICADDPTPTWEIRARRIIHDEVDDLLYFDRATFRLFGLPIAYFPRLVLPDPTNTRRTGLLIPSLSADSELGFGIKQPLFVVLGPSQDLTLTPYLSPRTRTLEATYRRATRLGPVTIAGAVSEDDLYRGGRSYVFADADLTLPRGYTLQADIRAVSDPGYLYTYDYSDRDRLRSAIRLGRVTRDSRLGASVSRYETLRGAELALDDELPSRTAEFGLERRTFLGRTELSFGVDGDLLYRDSDADDLGRDVLRLGADTLASHRRVTPSGLVIEATAGTRGDLYITEDDKEYSSVRARIVPEVSTTLRMPLARQTPTGQFLLEPVAQVALSDSIGGAVPNEDSLLQEFDEGNLLSLSRFPGQDRVQTGARAALGLGATRIAGAWTLGATVGRIVTTPEGDRFNAGSGLGGTTSDWLAAARFSLGTRLDVSGRAVLGSDGRVSRGEARIAFGAGDYTLDTALTFLEAEPLENRFFDTQEIVIDASARLSRHILGAVEGRYDVTERSASEAGIALTYRTECIDIDLGLTRRFAEPADLDASTTLTVGLQLAGFGSGRNDQTYRKSCQG